ncbi:MAG: hypothetical protein ABIQ95_15615, partial [Bdellovibrionia bacterium]
VDHPVLDRNRKPKEISEADAAANAEKQAAKPNDPFGKFRKLFNPKSKIKGAAAGSAGHMPKGGAGRKTPAAGGGSSKAGGSSS